MITTLICVYIYNFSQKLGGFVVYYKVGVWPLKKNFFFCFSVFLSFDIFPAKSILFWHYFYLFASVHFFTPFIQTDEQANEWMNERMDGWMNKWMTWIDLNDDWTELKLSCWQLLLLLLLSVLLFLLLLLLLVLFCF